MSRKAIAQRIRRALPDFGEAWLKSMVDQVFDAIEAELADKGSIRIERFGTFSRTFREGRRVRHPGTGEMTTTVAQHVIRFREAKPRKRS